MQINISSFLFCAWKLYIQLTSSKYVSFVILVKREQFLSQCVSFHFSKKGFEFVVVKCEMKTIFKSNCVSDGFEQLDNNCCIIELAYSVNVQFDVGKGFDKVQNRCDALCNSKNEMNLKWKFFVSVIKVRMEFLWMWVYFTSEIHFSELLIVFSEVKKLFWLIKYPFHNKVCWTNKAMQRQHSDKNSLPRSNLLRISFKIQSTKQSI